MKVRIKFSSIFTVLELLKEGLIERCCLGHNNLHFIKKSNIKKFTDQYRPLKESQIVLPVEANKDEGDIMGFKYSPLVHFKSIKFFSKKQEKDHVQMLRNLAQSTLETWPLFVVAMALALLAGTIIWIMVSRGVGVKHELNQNDKRRVSF